MPRGVVCVNVQDYTSKIYLSAKRYLSMCFASIVTYILMKKGSRSKLK